MLQFMPTTPRRAIIQNAKPMQDLYDRLKERGFDAAFLKGVVLPDWWEDKLAAVPANRALAEAAIAKQLGFKIAELRDPKRALPVPAIGSFRLKRHKNVPAEELRPAVHIAQRLAALVVAHTTAPAPFGGSVVAEKVRGHILADAPAVDLASLLTFAWRSGIVVFHVLPERLPRAAKKFAGLALYCGNVPVIVLGSVKQSPPWLAFHLAHEMGHLFLGHVNPGEAPLVDADIDRVDDDAQEKQADAFANKVLTGQEKPGFRPEWGLTAAKLAKAAQRWGAENGVAAGTVALVYARSANRWGPGQLALQTLGEDAGAHAIIAEHLKRHVDMGDLPESSARFLSCLSIGDSCD